MSVIFLQHPPGFCQHCGNVINPNVPAVFLTCQECRTISHSFSDHRDHDDAFTMAASVWRTKVGGEILK